jgi:hypothetical protein
LAAESDASTALSAGDEFGAELGSKEAKSVIVENVSSDDTDAADWAPED